MILGISSNFSDPWLYNLSNEKTARNDTQSPFQQLNTMILEKRGFPEILLFSAQKEQQAQIFLS